MKKKEDILSQAHSPEFYIMKNLTAKIKSYVLSFRPELIEVNSFINHIYHIYLNAEILRIKTKYDVSKAIMLEYVKKAVLIVVAELIKEKKYTGDITGVIRLAA